MKKKILAMAMTVILALCSVACTSGSGNGGGGGVVDGITGEYPTAIPSYDMYKDTRRLEHVAFWTPPPTDQHYQWLAESGMTQIVVDAKYNALPVSETMERVLSLCEKYDITAYPVISRDMSGPQREGTFDNYFRYKSFGGFYTDEPLRNTEIDNIVASADNCFGKVGYKYDTFVTLICDVPLNYTNYFKTMEDYYDYFARKMIATSDWFVFDEYEFVTPTAHTITVTGGTADKSSAKVNEKVTLTVTDSAVPSGKSFVGWKVNGKDISGNEFVMPDEDVTVIAIYAIDELTIPEGAYMLNDFSTGAVGTDWNGYGNGESQHGWLAEYDGRAGVEYIELTADNSNGVVRDVTPAYNLDQYNKVTLRVKAVSDCFTEMCIFTGTSPAAGNNGSDAKWIHANNSSELSAMDGWIEITLDISCLKTNNSDNNNANICIFVSNASKNKGIALYIDQIYLWNDSGTISG